MALALRGSRSVPVLLLLAFLAVSSGILCQPARAEFTFGTDRRVSDIAPYNWISHGMRMAAAWGDTVSVVWNAIQPPSNFAIYSARSVNGARSFDPAVLLWEQGDADWGSAPFPVVAVGPGGLAAVAYAAGASGDPYRYGIWVRCSRNRGATFGPEVRADEHVPGFGPGAASVAIAPRSGNVYVAYGVYSPERCEDEIRLARSRDGGESFEPSVRVDGYYPGARGALVAVAPDETVHVLWQRVDWGGDVLLLHSSTDEGATFEFRSLVTGVADYPTLTISPSGALYVTGSRTLWGGFKSRTVLFRSIDDGRTFERMSELAPREMRFSVSVATGAGDDVYVGRQGWRVQLGGAAEVWASHDGGRSFPEKQLINEPVLGFALWPILVSSGDGRLYAVWGDNRDHYPNPDRKFLYADVGVEGHPALPLQSNGDVGDAAAVRVGAAESTPLVSRKLSVQPNPFAESTRISWEASAVGTGGATLVEIFDIHGRQLTLRALGGAGSGSLEWTPRDEHLPPGLYFVRLRAGSWSETRRLVFAP